MLEIGSVASQTQPPLLSNLHRTIPGRFMANTLKYSSSISWQESSDSVLNSGFSSSRLWTQRIEADWRQGFSLEFKRTGKPQTSASACPKHLVFSWCVEVPLWAEIYNTGVFSAHFLNGSCCLSTEAFCSWMFPYTISKICSPTNPLRLWWKPGSCSEALAWKSTKKVNKNNHAIWLIGS